jgi:choline dehydrogenase-like flavoprotein
MAKKEFDIIIIGGGASGLFAAIPLIEKGYSVVIIEKGKWREETEFDNDELYTYIDQKDWPNQREEFSVIDVADNTPPFAHRMGQSYGYVGGGTITYAGVSERFRLKDFTKRSDYGDIEGLNLCDWPKGFYEELEPFYGMAEKLLGVSGDSSEDPTTPPRTGKLLPPLTMHPINHQMKDAAKRLNWHPYPVPLAISSVYNPESNRTWCVSGGLCSGYRCIWNSKGSADEVFKEKVKNYSNYTVLTNHIVESVQTDANGSKVQSVRIRNRKTKTSELIYGDRVILAAGGILSPALLLMSKNSKHPKGLLNENDLVGRNLMFHIEGQKGAVFQGDFKKEKFSNVKKVMVSDHYIPKDNEFINHITIQAGTKTGPIRYATKKTQGGWGSSYLKNVFNDYMNYYEFQVMVEDLPNLDNTVTLDPLEKDVDGLPCVRITHRYHKMDALALLKSFELAELWAKEMGGTLFTRSETDLKKWKEENSNFHPPWRPIGFHLMGTLRMGDEVNNSVVNRNCEAHSLKGLFVVDSSIFPTSAGVNPTLTIQANALRVANHIIKSDGNK